MPENLKNKLRRENRFQVYCRSKVRKEIILAKFSGEQFRSDMALQRLDLIVRQMLLASHNCGKNSLVVCYL